MPATRENRAGPFSSGGGCSGPCTSLQPPLLKGKGRIDGGGLGEPPVWRQTPPSGEPPRPLCRCWGLEPWVTRRGRAHAREGGFSVSPGSQCWAGDAECLPGGISSRLCLWLCSSFVSPSCLPHRLACRRSTAEPSLLPRT